MFKFSNAIICTLHEKESQTLHFLNSMLPKCKTAVHLVLKESNSQICVPEIKVSEWDLQE